MLRAAATSLLIALCVVPLPGQAGEADWVETKAPDGGWRGMVTLNTFRALAPGEEPRDVTPVRSHVVAFVVSFEDASHIAATTGPTIFFSADAGTTWKIEEFDRDAKAFWIWGANGLWVCQSDEQGAAEEAEDTPEGGD